MTDETLRVLMVCARYLPDVGGIETHVHEVARRLATVDGFEVTVLTTDRTRKRAREEVLEGVNVLRVPAWPRRRDYYFAPQISSVVGQRDRWHVIHCQGIHTPVPLLAMRAARRAKIPYVVTFHTGGHSLKYRNTLRSVQWRLAGPLLRGAESLVGVSRFEAKTISEQAHLGSRSISVIRNGGTLPPPPEGTAPVTGRIVSSGRLEKYKGHHRVIGALPYVLREIPEAHLIILGSGSYEPELRALASRLAVSDRVSITQVAPSDRTAMAGALAEASVVAALSDYEAHPVAVMEALSVGRPVVGYDTSGIGDLVTEGWVWGIRPGSSAALIAQTMVQAMSSPSLVDPARLPTWDDCAEQLMRVYVAAASTAFPVSGTEISSPQHPVARLQNADPGP